MRIVAKGLMDVRGRSPDEFRVEERTTDVVVSTFSYFDRTTCETDHMTIAIDKDEYEHALQQLQTTGRAIAKHRHGTLSLVKKADGKLSVTMSSLDMTIEVPDFSFDLLP